MWTDADVEQLGFDPRLTTGPFTDDQLAAVWDWLNTPTPPAGPPTVRLTRAEVKRLRDEAFDYLWRVR